MNGKPDSKNRKAEQFVDVRILQEQDIYNASALATFVYEQSVRPYGIQPDMAQAFYEYNRPENLLAMMCGNRAVLWGAFEGTQLAAMSAMQTEGHITMLYVLPQLMHRGYGTALLKAMEEHASAEWGIRIITVNVTPVWSEYFFTRRRFIRAVQMPPNAPFIPMEAKLKEEVRYAKRPFPARAAMILGILLVVVSFALTCGYMLSIL